MPFISLRTLGLVAVCLYAANAHAADMYADGTEPAPDQPRYFIHLGPGGVILDEGATMAAAGTTVPGATISIEDQITGVLEIGAFLTPNIAVSFTGGFPPTAEIEAAGTMNGLGRVGTTVYGPMTLTAHYHFTQFGAFQPYVGAGPAFMVVFDEDDGVMNGLEIDNTIGFAVQVGADYMFNERWGIFADVKKAILRTEATGSLGGIPIQADVKLDPLVVQGGVTFRF